MALTRSITCLLFFPLDMRDQLAGLNDRLRHLIRQLQRMRFGKRSEKLDPDQLDLVP
jgi:Transposase C of IS166 homeodomain